MRALFLVLFRNSSFFLLALSSHILRSINARNETFFKTKNRHESFLQIAIRYIM